MAQKFLVEIVFQRSDVGFEPARNACYVIQGGRQNHWATAISQKSNPNLSISITKGKREQRRRDRRREKGTRGKKSEAEERARREKRGQKKGDNGKENERKRRAREEMKEKERKVDIGEEKEEEEEEERTREKGREKGTRAKESEADKSAVGYRAPAAGDGPGVGWAARRPLGRDGRTSEILCTDERSIMYPASLKWQEKRKPKKRPHISVSLAENNERAEDRKREKRRNKPQPKQTATPSEGTCTSPSGFYRRDRNEHGSWETRVREETRVRTEGRPAAEATHLRPCGQAE